MSAPAEAVPATERAGEEERVISLEVDDEILERLQAEYERLEAPRNPRMSFDGFVLMTIRIGLDRLREMPAEKVLDLLADSEPEG